MGNKKTMPPPYKNKTIEFIKLIDKPSRRRAIKEAGFNTFLLDSGDVYIDLLTDSGTSAMSDEQWAGLLRGDESYAGSRSFSRLDETVKELFGYKYVVPTHQGRGAEHLMSRVLINQGGYVPNNMYFTTSRVHQEMAGANAIDVSVCQAHDPNSYYPFKGNIQTSALEECIGQVGPAKIPFVRMEACLNMSGGQPFSLANIKEVSRMCGHYGIFFLLDATRIIENAHFIREREQGLFDRTIKSLVREICSLTDGCTMSSKKDHFVNIGGFCAVNDSETFQRLKEQVVIYEGMHTYGGMAGRDMEALAIGMRESVECEELVSHYTGQIRFLHEELSERFIPVVNPPGAHAVFLDAKRFFHQIPQNEFPAQTLTAEIYIEGGIRSMERGIVSGQHGNEPYKGLELVRLTLPRRVYEQTHLQYVVDIVENTHKRRDGVKGLRITYEPEKLRFFQARFERIK